MIHSVLVVYKKSAYQIYVREKRNPRFLNKRGWDIRRLLSAHKAHKETLAGVEQTLREAGLPYRMIYRAALHDYAPYDLVVSVGGDGTLLEAARGVRRQLLLGVNSDPERSTGSYCSATGRTFPRALQSMLGGKARTRILHRMQLALNGKALDISVLNDILIAHQNPAAMSRYWIQIKGAKEEQRSSGVWVSTAAGSTGAMKSAGGRVLPRASKAIQYLPRELYWPRGVRYRLTGGVLTPDTAVTFGSLMREGMMFVDGEHRRTRLRYGDRLSISGSPYSLTLVDGRSR